MEERGGEGERERGKEGKRESLPSLHPVSSSAHRVEVDVDMHVDIPAKIPQERRK